MKKHWIAILILFVDATVWGMTFTLIKQILTHIAPTPFIFWRFTIGGIVLLIPALMARRVPRNVLAPGTLLGILVFLGYWLQTRGLMLITPSRSALLTGLYVVMVPFCDRFLYRARIPPVAWIGAVLAVIGTGLLIGGFDTRPQIGDVLTVMCAVCFSLHVILSAKYSVAASAIALAGVQVLVVGLVAAIPAATAPHTPMSRDVFLVILFTAIVTTAFAFVGLMWSQAQVSATEAAVILAFEPLAAAVTSVIYYGEPLTVGFVAGAMLIVAAMIVTQLRASPHRDPIAP